MLLAGVSLAGAAMAQETQKPATDARWATPSDGTMVALVRSGELRKSPALDVFVCQNGGSQNVSVISYRERFTGMTTQPLRPRECLLVKKAADVFVQNTGATPSVGIFQLRAPVKIGPPRKVVAPCGNLSDETSTQNPALAKFYGHCLARLGPHGSYRVCFDAAYADPQGQEAAYPGTLLPLIVDKKLLTQFPDAVPHLRWNTTVAQSCRDLIDVAYAAFLVAPEMAPGQGGGWDPTVIRDVRMTVQRLRLSR